MGKGVLAKNPATSADLPRQVESDVGYALTDNEVTDLLDKMRGSVLFEPIALAVLTGVRLGELVALQWSDFDPAAKTLRVERALEWTREYGFRVKEPKSRRGRRTIKIDPSLVNMLLALKEKYLRLAAGISDAAHVDFKLVKLPPDALIFPSPLSLTRWRNPRSLTKETRERFRKLGFSQLRSFQDLRVTHVTALLDRGVPVQTIAERTGHDVVVMLKHYGKRTRPSDEKAAAVIGSLSARILERK
jgi:integrase